MSSSSRKIGLALSGGGFRASLYHLGLLRFLRDAGILSQVTHITSVSGGSIMAAHLALNWARYTGGANEFDAAASELLDDPSLRSAMAGGGAAYVIEEFSWAEVRRRFLTALEEWS